MIETKKQLNNMTKSELIDEVRCWEQLYFEQISKNDNLIKTSTSLIEEKEEIKYMQDTLIKLIRLIPDDSILSVLARAMNEQK